MDSSPIFNPASVINLNLSFKNLISLDDSKKYKNLIEIDLTGNSFDDEKECEKVLYCFPYLKKINLAFNNLDHCWELPLQIETLILNNNALSSINSNLLRLSNLITIDLSNNLVQDIISLCQLKKLKFVFLKNNKISAVGCLADLAFLIELDVEGNPIEDRDQIMKFGDHQSIKILNLRNTPLLNPTGESQINGQNSPSPLGNLPFIKEGALCRNAKSLRNSYTYATITETSNPNRSALINKSLINSRKYSSDSAFSDEFDEEEEEDILHEIPGSILGSVRSNYLESVGLITSENSKRHDRKQSNLTENKGQISNFDSKASSNDKEPEKISNDHNSTSSNPFENSVTRSVNTSLYNKKPSMRLDLSSILKNKGTGQTAGNVKNFNQLHPNGSYINTANTSLFNSLNNSQIKISPIFADPNNEKPTPKDFASDTHGRTLLKLNLAASDLSLMNNNPKVSFKLNEQEKPPSSVGSSENVGPNTINRSSIESYFNNLLEDYNGLKQKVSTLQDINQELERKLAEAEKFHQEQPTHKTETTTLEEETKKLLALLSSLERSNESLKEDLYLERSKNNEIDKALRRVAKNHIGTEYTEKIDCLQIIGLFDQKLKKSQANTTNENNRRVLEQFDQLRENYRFLISNAKNNEEKLLMRVNDLESQISMKYNDKFFAMQRLLKSYQRNLDLVMKKYNSLKQTIRDQKPREESQPNNSSHNRIQARRNPTLFTDYSIDNMGLNQNTSLNLTTILENTHISEAKDEDFQHLKHENIKLKQSRDDFRKKFETAIKENDELKTVTSRNTYSLQLKIKDLESENKRLLAVINKGEITRSPKPTSIHNSVNLNDSKVIQNTSIELKPRGSHLNSSLVAERQSHTSLRQSSANKSSIKQASAKPRENIRDPIGIVKYQNYIQTLKKQTSDYSQQKNTKDAQKSYIKQLSKMLESSIDNKRSKKIA